MHSSPPQPDIDAVHYAGHDLLSSCEQYLPNYCTWIVKKIVAYLPASGTSSPKVLDFGAGIGTLATHFVTLTGITPTTVEIDPRQREILRKQNFLTYASLDDVQDKFNFIYTSNVLEHIEDDVQTLVALKNRLVDNGCLVIYVPAFMMLWSPLDDKVSHCRRYTKKNLSEKLALAGFQVKDIRYCDSVGFFLTLLFKAIGNESGDPGRYALMVFDKILFPISTLLDKVTGRFFGKNVLALAVA